jgi:holo-[acyl-carrier protein] synthase
MLGIDVVGIERLRETLARSPGLLRRLFTPGELEYCNSKADPARHLAGTLAAKEAVIKALQLGPLGAWAQRIEVAREANGAPNATVSGGPQGPIPISISHDNGLAVAVAEAPHLVPADDIAALGP